MNCPDFTGGKMKYLFLSFVLVILLPSKIFSQWYPQNSGTTSSLVLVQFIDQNTGWTIGTDSQNVHILFKTTNGGVDWFEQDTLLLSPGFITTFYFLNNYIGWVAGYKFDETSDIYKTTDGGNSWFLRYSIPLFETVLEDIQFTDTLNGFSVGLGPFSSGFVYKSTDGGNNWALSLGADSAIMTQSLSFINKDTGWVAGSNIFKTTDGGITWQEQLNIEPGNFISIRFVNDNTGWASTLSSIFKTTDGGDSWFQQSLIASTRTCFIDTLYGWLINGSDIYATNDGGDNWILQSSNNSEDLQDIFFIDQSLGWAVGNNGTILHTINGGTPVEFESFTAEINNNEILLKWQTATEINNRGFEVQRSKVRDQRLEWKNLGFVPGKGTTTVPNYYSFNDNEISSRIQYYRLKQVDYNGSCNYSKEIEVDVTAPTKFSCEQNYPNPFNSMSTIRFSIPKEVQVDLSVYNILGEKVKELKNEVTKPGYFEVEFDASMIASGVYFYRIQAGDFIQTKKMILLK